MTTEIMIIVPLLVKRKVFCFFVYACMYVCPFLSSYSYYVGVPHTFVQSQWMFIKKQITKLTN